jgi:hypothetical protein
MNPTNQPPTAQQPPVPAPQPVPQPGQPSQFAAQQPMQPAHPNDALHPPAPQPGSQPAPVAIAPAPAQTESQEQKIEHAVEVAQSSEQVLHNATSVFPFQLFPDTITIDREKINIVKRTFFRAGEVTAVHINDILSVAANAGPFLGSLKITLRNVNQDPIEVQHLSRKDALRIKSMLQGYIIARRNGIDCMSMEKPQLISVLLRLGSGQAGATSM